DDLRHRVRCHEGERQRIGEREILDRQDALLPKPLPVGRGDSLKRIEALTPERSARADTNLTESTGCPEPRLRGVAQPGREFPVGDEPGGECQPWFGREVANGGGEDHLIRELEYQSGRDVLRSVSRHHGVEGVQTTTEEAPKDTRLDARGQCVEAAEA